MRSICHRPLFCLSLLIIIFLCSGCIAITITPEPQPVTTIPDKKLSIPVGIYYSPEFENYTYKRLSGNSIYSTQLGQSSVEFLDQVFWAIFKNPVHVSTLPPYKNNKHDISLVIEPVIEDFDHILGFEKHTDRKSITYRFNMYNTAGTPITSWTIKGKAKYRWWYAPPVWSHISRDMRDAGMKLASKIGDEIENYQHRLSMHNDLEIRDNSEIKGILVDVEVVQQPEFIEKSRVNSFQDAGIIALNITVINRTQHEIIISEPYMRLLANKGRAIPPTNSQLVVGRLLKRGIDYSTAEDLLGSLGNIFSSSAATLSSTNSVIEQSIYWDKIQSYARNNVAKFGQKVMAPGSTVNGMLFFQPAHGTKDFNEAGLSIWVHYPKIGHGLRLVVPVTNLNFIDK